MKQINYYVIAALAVLFFLQSKTQAGNILGDIINIYTKYEQANMMMWLAGDTKAEKRFGEEIKWYINLTNKKTKDPETNRWVHSIFDRVKTQFRDRGFDYNITVLEGSTVNAFAIPGGNVYVYKGMLDFVGSDDELAAVLAHELTHSEKRHSLKQLRQSTVFQLLLDKAVKNKRDRDSWGQLVGALTSLKFSRQDEDEADDIGQKKMFTAGFDPAAQVLLWQKFTDKFGKGEKGLLQYLSSHPPSQERVENARRNLTGMKMPEHKDFGLSFNIMSDAKENLLQNSSFETDLAKKGYPDAWTIRDGKSCFSQSESVTGKNSLELTSASNMEQVRVVSELIPINTNEKYILAGWTKSTDGKQKASVGAELYDKAKRLRGFIWPILSSLSLPNAWTKFEGVFESGNVSAKNFQKDTAFMRIALQNGPLSKGSIWFDALELRRSTAIPPKNYLPNGDFEIVGKDNLPEGVNGTPNALSRDIERFKTGYSSLCIKGREGVETQMEFSPISISEFKDGQILQCSFHFCGSPEIKARLLIELLDEAGNQLSKRLIEKEFKTKADIWQAISLKTEFRLQPEEKKLAKTISVKVIGAIPATGKLWLDGFILR